MGLIYQSNVETSADPSAQINLWQITCDLWNIRMPPIPSYERSYIDKCGSWKQSSFEYHAPKNTLV